MEDMRHRRHRGLGYSPQEHATYAATARARIAEAGNAAVAEARLGHCEAAVKRLVDAARAQGVYVTHAAQTGDPVIAASSLELDRAIHFVATCWRDA